MKKLAFFLVVLISFTVIAGCQSSRKKVTRFSTDESGKVEISEDSDTKTTITKLDDDRKVEMEPIEIPSPEDDTGGFEFAVTSLEKNVAESDKGYHLIQGTTPKNTARIVVNSYPLNKYKPGNTEWSYIAAVSLGTLKKGDNHYSIRAFDTKGKVIGSESFTIVYKGIYNGALVDTGNSLTVSLMVTILGLFGFYAIRRRAEY